MPVHCLRLIGKAIHTCLRVVANTHKPRFHCICLHPGNRKCRYQHKSFNYLYSFYVQDRSCALAFRVVSKELKEKKKRRCCYEVNFFFSFNSLYIYYIRFLEVFQLLDILIFRFKHISLRGRLGPVAYGTY